MSATRDPFVTTITWMHLEPAKRATTMAGKLEARIGRVPTHGELCAEVARILDKARTEREGGTR